MGNRRIQHFVIDNQIEKLSDLVGKIEKLAENWELSPALARKINLVIEEAFSNIVFYAYPDNDKHKINISVSLHNKRLTIEITDDGIPFNPLAQQPPDTSLPVDERPVGGLGIFLISQIMDEMHYERKKNRNILTLNKSI
jgi:anti-sigma regulatory factor (Ser/Thr protein kinase)